MHSIKRLKLLIPGIRAAGGKVDDQKRTVTAAEAAKAGLVNLEGHRSVGGMRASLYNAVSLVAAQALVDFMREFARRNG